MEKKGIIWKFIQTLNPLSFDKLATDRLSEAAFYMPKMLLAAFAIMLLLSLPLLFSLPSQVDILFGKTKDVNVNIDIENEAPISIPEYQSFITIDKKANISDKFASKILITNESVAFKPMMCQIIPITCSLYDFGNVKVEKNLGGYSDVLSHKQFYTYLLAGIFFMMLPGILLLSYLMFLLKYFAITLLFSVLAFAITRMSRFEISFSEIIKISFYASTLMILVEIITIPFPVRLYFSHLAIFLVYMVLGILRTGYPDRTPRRKTKKQRGQYVELGRGHDQGEY